MNEVLLLVLGVHLNSECGDGCSSIEDQLGLRWIS